MTRNRPVPQGRTGQALGPGFGVNGINAMGLNQHVALDIHHAQEIHFLGLGVGMALQGNNHQPSGNHQGARHRPGMGERTIS